MDQSYLRVKEDLLFLYCRNNNLTINEYYFPDKTHHFLYQSHHAKPFVISYYQSHAYSAMLHDAIVFDAGYVISSDNHLFFRGLCFSNYRAMFDNLFKEYIIEADEKTRAYTLDIKESNMDYIDDECVLIGGFANFGHWMFQFMTKALLFEFNPELKNKKILIADTVLENCVEYFLRLGFDKEQLIRYNKAVRVKKLWVLSTVCYRGNYEDRSIYVWPNAAHYLRQKLLFNNPFIWPNIKKPQQRIYVSRKNAKHRRVLNEDQLLNMLAKYDFTVVEMENLSVEQQIQLISNTQIGILSAGASNQMALLAPSDCSIIEFSQPHIQGEWGRIWSVILGQHHNRLDGRLQQISPEKEIQPLKADDAYDIEIDVNAVEKIIQTSLNRRFNLHVEKIENS